MSQKWAQKTKSQKQQKSKQKIIGRKIEIQEYICSHSQRDLEKICPIDLLQTKKKISQKSKNTSREERLKSFITN